MITKVGTLAILRHLPALPHLYLFPRLPRHNLREARALVKPFCEHWGVPYHEVGFVQSNVELVRGLRDVARKCRQYGLKSVGGFGETQLYAGLHAEG